MSKIIRKNLVYALNFAFGDKVCMIKMWSESTVWFYGISTIEGYLMPNPLYTYILNIYDLVWLGLME